MLKLRPFKMKDVKEVVSWINGEKEYFQWSAGQLGGYPLTETVFEKYSLELERNDRMYQMIACIDETPVGYLTMRYTDEGCSILRLGFIILSPKFRGKGYGKKMIRLALHFAFELLKVKKVTLGVFENNEEAYQCYLHSGFTEVNLEEKEQYEILDEIWGCREFETISVKGQEVKMDPLESDENMIEEIIQSNAFHYVYQPIVSASTGDIFGYEALMRTDYGKKYSPDIIIHYAGKKNLLYEIEHATFFNVFEQIKRQEEELGDKKIFVNSIPGFQLTAEDYQDFLGKYSNQLHKGVIEITEATELQDEDLDELINRAKNAGFELAIDDYGTGYSNTTNLLRNLPRYVKIDRLLISNIHGDTKKQHFVRSLIEFGHSNGIMILAEGVENSAELKCVIQLGIDLIQGFYTARPSLELKDEIDPSIKNEIINTNLRGQTQTNRNVYVVEDEAELPLMRIALEQNTGILISQPEFTLVGNPNYTAAMSIKIKDGCSTRLVLRNVLLESFQDMPCIELGKNVDLTVVLEGSNQISKVGICVPEGSHLRIEGDGNLSIHVLGIQSYAIGNLWDSAVGSITYAGTGNVNILVESDESIGIGGGFFSTGSGIEIASGSIFIESASGKTIGLGSVHGTMPISIHDCEVKFDFRIDKGIGIGSLYDNQDISLSECSVTFISSGNSICCMGSVESTGGDITIKGSDVSITMNGQKVKMIGTLSGSPHIEVKDSILEMRGEGSEVLVLGSNDQKAHLHMKRTNCNIIVRSGIYHIYGATEEYICLEGGHSRCRVNE